jgi:hypothetical protein
MDFDMTARARGAAVAALAGAVAVSLATPRAASAQELETETARLLKAGAVKGGAGFEYQTSADGSESALPLFIEGGLLDRLELVIEPVAYTAIRPRVGARTAGPGDVEITLVGLALEERPWLPALAVAAEVKVPTAKNASIGTGKYDYAGYLILSKRFGRLDTHFNAAYTVVGKPAGIPVNNIFSVAAAARFFASERYHLFAEILANTAATPEAEGAGGMGVTPELAGNELVGTVGAGFYIVPSVLLSLGVSYDNNQAILIHPGVIIAHAFL